MEDMERYGDYNEVDEAPGGKNNIVVLLLKLSLLLVCVLVVGVLGFRVFLFNTYPDSAKNIYFTDNLKEYYFEHGEINAQTQKLRSPYDDADAGNFFCDNLIVIREAGSLQVSVRFNTSAIENIERELSLSGLSADDADLLTFRLYRNGESEREEDHLIGTLAYKELSSKMMYRYYKLAFEDVDFGEGEDKIEWIRLEIFVKGQEGDKPFAMIPIYEDNADFSYFTEYKIKEEMLPK